MDKETLVFSVHVFIGVALAGFGLYRGAVGQVLPGALNVTVAALVVGAGKFIAQSA